ncbi:glycosyltransferase [Aminipila terrae]|uniref:Glycosyltransferase n=1 Tax=Aminipila terrae TaxID=2697030 RepID=A0A6P1MIP5_9FIRM|nr:glycosyltransferase [Aminipila terrae]
MEKRNRPAQTRRRLYFVTSQKLYEFNRGYKDKTYFCQNGADFNHFAPATNIFCDKPDDIRNIKGPVIGYFGAVADWIDWKLIKFLAEKNQFSIVIIGPLFKLREFPVKRENLFYLGEKDYGVLPDYLQCFDVCIIPFLKNKLTSACNPIKMYEYLSAGKPVITTDLEECRIETIKTSKTYQEFYDNITLCLNNDDAIQREKRIHFARQNSWMQRVRSIRSVIEPRLEQ